MKGSSLVTLVVVTLVLILNTVIVESFIPLVRIQKYVPKTTRRTCLDLITPQQQQQGSFRLNNCNRRRLQKGIEFVSRVSSSSTASIPTTLPFEKADETYNSNGSNENAMTPTPSLLVNSNADTRTTTMSTSNGSSQSRKELIKKEGGIFAINTKYGGLNLFSLYYGFIATIVLGIPWFICLSIYEIFQKITGERYDKNRMVPIFMNHVWGTLLMRLTRCYPKMIDTKILKEFYQQKRCAMFVANHCSWMDIPFLGATIGWRNYKIIAKMELGKVPILGKAIRLGGNLMVDRTDKKSGLVTLKRGIQYLKDGVHVCTFPEGTRSRTGQLMSFKSGAFKIAHKAGAPVIPISIVGAQTVNPPHWIFPYRAAHNHCQVIVHEPIESTGISEEELANQVRIRMISGLPVNQRPPQELDNTSDDEDGTPDTRV